MKMKQYSEDNPIKVVDYDYNWAKVFEELKAIYKKEIRDDAISIEHVGSTSVVGLKAKPKLDIDIVVADDDIKKQKVIAALEKLGYLHVGDLGIAGREAFKRESNQTPNDGSQKEWMEHNLYVCKENNTGLKNHLTLRDYLRENPDAAREYGALKQKLADLYPYDIDAYIDGKTDFILNILNKVGMMNSELSEIEKANKLKN